MIEKVGAVLATLGGIAAVCAVLSGCPGNCATYVLGIVVLDQTSGNLLCEGRVVFGVGDSGVLLDASSAASDAEVPKMSDACQWDVVVGGGTYQVNVSVPGFKAGSATVQLSKDECGSADVPVTVILERR